MTLHRMLARKKHPGVRRCLAAVTALVMATFLTAEPLPQPEGPIVLTVTGNITQTNQGDAAVFDYDMLSELEQGQIETVNPWADGMNTYSGPLGTAILDAVGAQGNQLVLQALNDYSAPVPASDLSEFSTVFATHQNGRRLSVRDRGPLFLIYPFSRFPELESERYHNRSVWQIDRVQVQ